MDLVTGMNPYQKFYSDRAQYFDFAFFPRDHIYFDGTNNKVIGMFKDEANGAQITEFVGLRPKMYSFLSNYLTSPEKRAPKGIHQAVAKRLKHQDYLQELNNPTENRQINRRIGEKLHQIYWIQTSKSVLCAFYDKRILLEDGISTLANGHSRATGEVVDVGVIENETVPNIQNSIQPENADGEDEAGDSDEPFE